MRTARDAVCCTAFVFEKYVMSVTDVGSGKDDSMQFGLKYRN